MRLSRMGQFIVHGSRRMTLRKLFETVLIRKRAILRPGRGTMTRQTVVGSWVKVRRINSISTYSTGTECCLDCTEYGTRSIFFFGLSSFVGHFVYHGKILN